MRSNKKPYVGIDKDTDGGMTVAGRIIRDAWAFGIIPETETCAGWNTQGLEDLWNKTHVEWEKYGRQVNQLPEDIRGVTGINSMSWSTEFFTAFIDKLLKWME